MSEEGADPTPVRPGLDLAEERRLAIELFNHTWDLIGLADRTSAQGDAMVHAAHASRWHWGHAGGPREWAIGEWQCSRVYAVLGDRAAAVRHRDAAAEPAAAFDDADDRLVIEADLATLPVG